MLVLNPCGCGRCPPASNAASKKQKKVADCFIGIGKSYFAQAIFMLHCGLKHKYRLLFRVIIVLFAFVFNRSEIVKNANAYS